MGESEDSDAWIQAILPTKAWGLPERVKWKDQCSQSERLEISQEIEVPTLIYYFRLEADTETEYFKFEQECSEFEKRTALHSEATLRTQVTLRAQYTIEIQDMQAEIDAENQRKAAMLVLKQRVRDLSQMTDLTTAQVKESVFKLIKLLYLENQI